MTIDLTGKVAIVTGGAQGIGLAAGRSLAAAGARVVVADLHVEAATPEHFGYVPDLTVATDIAAEAAVQHLFAETVRRFGQVDIVVNSAGIYRAIPILEIEVAEWDRFLAVNLRGTFLVGREAFRHMKERRSGKVVNVASIAGKVGSVTAGAHYSASKAGVISFTKTLAFQAAEYHINVNAVCPGPIETDMIRSWDRPTQEAYAARIPWKEFGQAQDVADTIVFLASDRARYLTGEIIDVNGGLLMD